MPKMVVNSRNGKASVRKRFSMARSYCRRRLPRSIFGWAVVASLSTEGHLRGTACPVSASKKSSLCFCGAPCVVTPALERYVCTSGPRRWATAITSMLLKSGRSTSVVNVAQSPLLGPTEFLSSAAGKRDVLVFTSPKKCMTLPDSM